MKFSLGVDKFKKILESLKAITDDFCFVADESGIRVRACCSFLIKIF